MLQCHSRDCLPAPLQLNKGGVDFGRRSGGEPVGDVQLPPWAADAADFLYKLSEALEAPLVSARLHKWIDLVFGRKSRGAAAERADNVFHYLTYDDVARRFLAQEGDPGMREALRLQMMEFGRTPRQVGEESGRAGVCMEGARVSKGFRRALQNSSWILIASAALLCSCSPASTPSAECWAGAASVAAVAPCPALASAALLRPRPPNPSTCSPASPLTRAPSLPSAGWWETPDTAC